jgi:hypothetical protein
MRSSKEQCSGLGQPESNFTDDFMAFVSPSASIAGKRYQGKRRKQKTAHASPAEMIAQGMLPFGG